MSELRIFLRRDVPVDDCAWVLRDANGAVSASGSGLNDLPAARQRHLVLAADLVNTLPAALPDLSPRRLAPLLAAAAEADTLDEAEKLHVAWLGRDAAGLSWLAVLDRAWLTQTLAALREKSVEVDAALPETLLLPLAPDTWSVLWQEDGAVVRYAELRGLALDRRHPVHRHEPGLAAAGAGAANPASRDARTGRTRTPRPCRHRRSGLAGERTPACFTRGARRAARARARARAGMGMGSWRC